VHQERDDGGGGGLGETRIGQTRPDQSRLAPNSWYSKTKDGRKKSKAGGGDRGIFEVRAWIGVPDSRKIPRVRINSNCWYPGRSATSES